MRKHIRVWSTAALCAATAGCGSQHEARQPVSDTSAVTEEDDSQSPGASRSEPGEGSANRGIADICEKLNQRAAQKCSKKIAGLYRSSCRHYLKTPGRCGNEIRLALQCQYKAADDVLCAHQADPNCSQANRNLNACEHGVAPVEQTTAEDLTLPPGWEKMRDTQLGFTVAMPPGAKLDTGSKRRTWQAEEGGISYLVAEIDPPSGKLNNQAFVRAVIAYVGNRCQLHLKLHGELDIKGTTVVQYDSACPDGSEWHGMLHFWNGKAVSTGFHAPAGTKGVTEPFYYSFLITNQ